MNSRRTAASSAPAVMKSRPERPASQPAKHRRSHRRGGNPGEDHDGPGHARSEPRNQRPRPAGHNCGGEREPAAAHCPIESQRRVHERPCHRRVGRPTLPIACPSTTSGHCSHRSNRLTLQHCPPPSQSLMLQVVSKILCRPSRRLLPYTPFGCAPRSSAKNASSPRREQDLRRAVFASLRLRYGNDVNYFWDSLYTAQTPVRDDQ